MSHPNEDYRSSAMFEHRFWLQIMGDHARFILQALAPAETANIAKAEYFQHAFDRLSMNPAPHCRMRRWNI